MRQLCYRVHLWCGLCIALWLGLAGLTGSLLVFRPEIDEAGLAWSRVPPSGEPRDLDTLISLANTHSSRSPVRYVFPGVRDDVAWQCELVDGTRVLIDPYGGLILGSLDPHGTFFGRVREWHAHLLGGSTGSRALGFLGIASLVLVLTGAVIWWPRRKALARVRQPGPRLPKGKRAALLHRWLGLATTPLLILVLVTGITLAWGDWTTRGAKWLARDKAPNPPAVSAGQARLPWKQLLEKSEHALPAGQVTRIALPARPGGTFIVRKRLPGEVHPNGMNFIHLDASTGDVLHVRTAATQPWVIRLLDLRYPMHIGSYGGLLTRLLHLASGLGLVALAFTGLILACRRLFRSRPDLRRESREHKSGLKPVLHRSDKARPTA